VVCPAPIIHRFGRADHVDREALGRLVGSISRFLDPAAAVAATASGEVHIIESRAMGLAWVAGRLWERLEIGQTIIACAGGRRVAGERVERAIFAMVANRLSVKRLSKGGRLRVGQGAGVHRRASGGDRRRVLPGDGLPARGAGGAAGAGVLHGGQHPRSRD
jgi:hypothetical protein